MIYKSRIFSEALKNISLFFPSIFSTNYTILKTGCVGDKKTFAQESKISAIGARL